MGGPEAPHHGDFASFAICDNMCTLGGLRCWPTQAPIFCRGTSPCGPYQVAKHLDEASSRHRHHREAWVKLIYEHADPAAVVRAAR